MDCCASAGAFVTFVTPDVKGSVAEVMGFSVFAWQDASAPETRSAAKRNAVRMRNRFMVCTSFSVAFIISDFGVKVNSFSGKESNQKNSVAFSSFLLQKHGKYDTIGNTG